ncbi:MULTISPECIES: AzlD domain-containing protein [Desulfitobacterium]|uniref:AzlD domain-containing protein n=2 Tax=Desulfitobacterium dehalogenans TaxID=36854 RepID=A0A7C7D631_9FIRM|nr:MULTISPECIES: AzlD domain-containing protein [Desulfitobacterium]AFL99258.1 putative membrane protein [Desulfitobacterium dehalogenans ATCC 51507]HHY27156.1 AzlD domain-containing protein [Desulfitobacterium dehalogenans]
MKSYLLLITGMMVVTYLPRLLPLLIMTGRPLPPVLKRFLRYIPYTALSALIIRGIMQSGPDMRLATVVGILAAGICSWLRGSLVLSVLISIIAAFIVLQV